VGASHVAWHADREPLVAARREVTALARFVRAVRPDVVHLHSSKAGLIGRLAVRGRVPTVFQPHAWSFHAAGRASRAALAWERWASRWTDVTLCVSEGERDEAIARGIGGDLRVIANGIDLQRYTPASPERRAEARQALGIGDRHRLVVTPGRLSEQKGQDVLLRAWPGIRRRHPAARLALVGDGPLRRKLRPLADASVRFVGNVADVDRWLHAADLVVLPSRWEGLSLAMLEAMACGRSVITTAVAGARDALADGGGAVVPVGDPARLAEAIEERLANEDLVRFEEEQARKIVEARFDVERATSAIATTYIEIARSARRARTTGPVSAA
jgi:glycosyltransferase involved in cell wall biosynthesis